ncbi:MAG: phosphoribosylformylglycinamidine synthase subunit PurS [Bacteroidales bacterium]
MKYQVKVNIMPLKALLDPQGKAVTSSMKNIGLDMIENVRIGKHIVMEVEAESINEAKSIVEKACKELLYNPIMENYEIEILN